MKKIAVLFVLMGMFFCAKAQNNANVKVNADGPKIEFTKTVHDYGIRKKASDGSCQFVFKNTGTEPLILSNVASSCGCTVPTWPKDPVFPGSTGVIKVVYDMKQIAIFKKTIQVMSNAVNSTVELVLKGEVIE